MFFRTESIAAHAQVVRYKCIVFMRAEDRLANDNAVIFETIPAAIVVGAAIVAGIAGPSVCASLHLHIVIEIVARGIAKMDMNAISTAQMPGPVSCRFKIPACANTQTARLCKQHCSVRV